MEREEKRRDFVLQKTTMKRQWLVLLIARVIVVSEKANNTTRKL